MKRFLEGYALAHGTTMAKLVREVVAEWVYERVDHTPSKRVDHTLHRLDVLSKQLQLKAAVLPARRDSGRDSEPLVQIAGHLTVPGHQGVRQEEEMAPVRVDTVRERESMYWVVLAMLRESQKLSENEASAKQAGSRMDAMMVTATLARVGEAILEGYDRAYIQPHLDELTNLIEQLKEQLKQTDQKGQEDATGSAGT